MSRARTTADVPTQGATLTGTQTLTNKTLTTPVIASVSNSGTVTLPTGTRTLVARDTTDTLTNKTLTAPVISTISNSGTITLPTGSDTLVGRATTDTLTNKTLTAPVLLGPEERCNVVAAAATGTINLDVLTAGVWFYTTNASANHTLNIRGNSGTTLNSLLAVGDSLTVIWLVTNGATPYYPNVIQVDGSNVTPRWAGGTAPTAGNASSVDAYSFTVIKTAATPAYTVLGGQTRFA